MSLEQVTVAVQSSAVDQVCLRMLKPLFSFLALTLQQYRSLASTKSSQTHATQSPTPNAMIHCSGISTHFHASLPLSPSHVPPFPRPRRNSARRRAVSFLESLLEAHSTPGINSRRIADTPRSNVKRCRAAGAAWLPESSTPDCAGGTVWLMELSASDCAGADCGCCALGRAGASLGL